MAFAPSSRSKQSMGPCPAVRSGTALATVLGGTLLSPVLGGFSDLFGERLTASLYPAYLDPYTEDRDRSRSSRPVPSQLVLAAEVGVDLTERLNLSVLTAPNRSDIPAVLKAIFPFFFI